MSHAAAPSNADPSPIRPERLWREVVGDELRTVRQTRGESLRRVAGRARVSPQYLSEIERGSKEPSSEILAALGTALDLSLVDLTRGAAARLTAETTVPAAAPAAAPATVVTTVSTSASAFALAA